MARHVNRRVGPYRAGEHPDQADPADVRVRRRLDHLGQQRPLRVAAQMSAVLALRGEDVGQRMLERRREAAGRDLQQLQGSDAGAGACGDHREERAAGDRLLEILDQHLFVDLLAAEVALHQRLVFGLLDDSLDQCAAGLLDSVGVGSAGLARAPLAVGILVVRLRQQPDQPGARGVRGQVKREHLVAECVLRSHQRAVVVRPCVVEFRDHHRPGHADLLAFQPQRLGEFVDAFVGRDHEQCAVRRAQSGPQLTDEIGVSRRVDQVHLDAIVRERRQGEPDGSLLGDLGLVEVAHRCSVHDGPGSGQHAGGSQQGVDEGGLAATRRADEHHVSDGGRTVRGRGGSGALGIVRLVCHDDPFQPGSLRLGAARPRRTQLTHNSPIHHRAQDPSRRGVTACRGAAHSGRL